MSDQYRYQSISKRNYKYFLNVYTYICIYLNTHPTLHYAIVIYVTTNLYF